MTRRISKRRQRIRRNKKASSKESERDQRKAVHDLHKNFPHIYDGTRDQQGNKNTQNQHARSTKKKYPFNIACKLPFIAFPIGDGRTWEDMATLTGLLATGGCCNMGWQEYHQAIAEQCPQLVEEFIELEEEEYETMSSQSSDNFVLLTTVRRHLSWNVCAWNSHDGAPPSCFLRWQTGGVSERPVRDNYLLVPSVPTHCTVPVCTISTTKSVFVRTVHRQNSQFARVFYRYSILVFMMIPSLFFEESSTIV